MRVARYERYGSPKRVAVAEVDAPQAGPGEIVVRVQAASVNSWDIDKLTGNVLGRLDGPFAPRHKVLGAEVAGVIDSIGPGVNGLAVGDRVFGDLTESGWGGFAELVRGKAAAFLPMPEGLGFEEAACVPQAGLLALQGLRMHGGLRAGMRVLINGAGGGMGSFAIQLAKAAGAEVTAVDRGDKLAFMRGLGADEVIDYTQRDFARSGGAYDYVLDAQGRRSIGRHLGALADGGTYVLAGGSVSSLLQTALFGATKGKAQGKRVSLLFWRPLPADMQELAEMLAAGTLRAVIDRRFKLAETDQALAWVAEGHVKGKVVVVPA